MKCLCPKAKDADLRFVIWEEVRRVHQEGVLIATVRVARLTFQTRTLRLGRCRDRPSRALPLTCPNVKNVKKQMKRNASKKKNGEK